MLGKVPLGKIRPSDMKRCRVRGSLVSSTVSFLSQVEWDGFGRYAETLPDRGTLERFFFLDDADRELVAEHRGAHSRLGFALQLVTVRHMGRFLPNPLDGRWDRAIRTARR